MLLPLFCAATALAFAVLATAAHAYPHVTSPPAPSAGIVHVAQPTLGRPVQLHGVVNQVDAVNHRIDIVQLSGLEYFWQPTVHNCPVDPNLALPVLAQGTKVRFTLSRGAANRYYVSAIESY